MHSNSDIPYWLAASHLYNVGAATVRRWLTQFESVKALFTAPSSDLKDKGFKATDIKLLKNPDWKSIEAEMAWCQRESCHIVCLKDPTYPPQLKEISHAPLVLFVQGELELLSLPQVAMVGSRNPTPIGQETAYQFAKVLAAAGWVITSGLALGIDAASHEGALSGGKTIAVMGCGLQHIYPDSAKSLAEHIRKQGALVSEFSPKVPPKPKNFPQRNRVISGLSLGVLVVEAALRSGSLITARFALEQGREIFAIPGSIHNPLVRGCHFLLRQGAKLVETAEDIMEELRPLVDTTRHIARLKPHDFPADTLRIEQRELLEKIGYEVTAMDVILVRSGLTAALVSSMLLDLELRGCVKSVPGGFIRQT